MLVECQRVRQIRGEGHRRWFTDDYFDLIVWYDGPSADPSNVTGFQLCYDRGGYERALTWRRDRGYTHERVDTGESAPGSPKSTPILVADGVFDSSGVAERFREASRRIEPALADLVLEKLASYAGAPP